jgi:hypothetical protein
MAGHGIDTCGVRHHGCYDRGEGIQAAMKSGSLSCVALVQGYLARIKAYD